MTTEIKNDTNNNDTLEQNQNPGAPATPEATSPAPTTDPSATSDPSDDTATNPIIHQSNYPSLPPTNPPTQESIYPAAPIADPSNTSDPSDSSQPDLSSIASAAEEASAKEETPNSEPETMATPAAPAPALVTPPELMTSPAPITENCPPSAASDVTSPAADRLLNLDEPFPSAVAPNPEPEPPEQETSDDCCGKASAESRPCHTWPLPPRGQRNRMGKVAKLPSDILEWVNLQLLDEVPYENILEELDARGHGHINRQNLTNWKTYGGYEQWLSGHIARQERRAHLETVCSYITQCRGRLDEAAMLLLSSQLLSLVGDYDLGIFRKHLAQDPQAYLRLIQAVARLGKVRQGSKKIASASLAGKPSGQAKELEIHPESERGLTEETLKKITTAIKLF